MPINYLIGTGHIFIEDLHLLNKFVKAYQIFITSTFITYNTIPIKKLLIH